MPNVMTIVATCAVAVAAASQETAHLKITTSTSAETVAPGRKVTLNLDVEPKPKMHVYAPGQKDYIVIQLTLDQNAAIAAAKAKYPAGEKFVMPALNETQLVYSKPFRITQDVTVKSTAADRVTVTGTVRYQACDDKVCYRPQNVPVSWTVGVK